MLFNEEKIFQHYAAELNNTVQYEASIELHGVTIPPPTVEGNIISFDLKGLTDYEKEVFYECCWENVKKRRGGKDAG